MSSDSKDDLFSWAAATIATKLSPPPPPSPPKVPSASVPTLREPSSRLSREASSGGGGGGADATTTPSAEKAASSAKVPPPTVHRPTPHATASSPKTRRQSSSSSSSSPRHHVDGRSLPPPSPRGDVDPSLASAGETTGTRCTTPHVDARIATTTDAMTMKTDPTIDGDVHSVGGRGGGESKPPLPLPPSPIVAPASTQSSSSSSSTTAVGAAAVASKPPPTPSSIKSFPTTRGGGGTSKSAAIKSSPNTPDEEFDVEYLDYDCDYDYDDDDHNDEDDEDDRVPPGLDPRVVPAVHSIMHLLQIYGPLSYEQIKYNMVPQLVPISDHAGRRRGGAGVSLTGKRGGGGTRQTPSSPGGKERRRVVGGGKRKDKLRKVLDLLHELGVINAVDKGVKNFDDESKADGEGGGVGKKTTAAAIATTETAGRKTSQMTDGDGPARNENGPSPPHAAEGGREGGSSSVDAHSPPAEAASSLIADANSSNPPREIEEGSGGFVNNDPNPVYCFGNGVPRMDVVLPSRILDEIQEAGREVMRAQRRIELLRKALMAEDESPSMASADGTSTGNVENTAAAAGAPITTEASSGVAQPAILAMDDDDGRTAAPTKVRRRKQSPQQHAASVLRQLYQLHPEIANDPVYAAALRMFRVNVGTDIDHHRMNVENCPEVDVICRKILNDDGRMGSGPARHGKKRASSSDGQRRSASDGGEGASGGGGKKRKKGRPPKKSNSGDKLTKCGSAGESLAIRANASWT